MKLSYYHKALIVGAVAIFYTNLPLYLYINHDLVFLEAPKHWVILFCVALLPLVLTHTILFNGLKSPVSVWCFGYALLSVLSFFTFSHSDLAWQEVRTRFLTIIEIFAFVMIFWNSNATHLARKTLVAAVLLGVGLNIYELFAPLTFSTNPGRAAGLYLNPNLAGEALVLGMVLSVTVLKSQYRTAFVLFVGLGVFLTLSRGGILAWVLAVAGLLFVRAISSKEFVRSGFIAVVLVILVLLPQWDKLLTTWERTGVLNANVMERLAWFTDPSGVSDRSSWERQYVAETAWSKVAEHPFIGGGTGSFHQARVPPHNLYLTFMLDHGAIGALIIPLLALAFMLGARGESRSLGIIFGCTMMILSLFTHMLLDYSYNVLLVALMAAMAANHGAETQRTAAREIRIAVAPQSFKEA